MPNIVSKLINTANILDAVGTEDAVQVAEGIDAVLGNMKTAASWVSNARVVLESIQKQILDMVHNPKINMKAPTDFKRKALDIYNQAGELMRYVYQGEWQDKTQEDIAITETGPTVEEPISGIKTSKILENLTKVANLFDKEGLDKAADLMDKVIKEAAQADLPNYPTRYEAYGHLYDAKANNKETMWENTKKEVDENRKQHHLTTMRGTAPALSSRYSPDLPGVMMLRVSDNVLQDPITRKIYDFENGYTLEDGTKVPGGSIKHQTPSFQQMTSPVRIFESGKK